MNRSLIDFQKIHKEASFLHRQNSPHDMVAKNDLLGLQAFCNVARNNPVQLDVLDEYSNTPLLKACYLGSLVCAKMLLQAGADIQVINSMGQNALTLATYSRNKTLVLELLKYRSYDDFNSTSMLPALMVAKMLKNHDLIALFKTFTHKHDDLTTVHGLQVNEAMTFN
ncbi:DNA replication inhibitor plutonium [Teleopsis dalmanni]|uniref:DNA replication inhibitor plutonium n=1 Tax=Teleopsis dalmanni TaxID=139649 RepID=UPI0018CF14A7|nr:DNA replication inhibitor plutonium [Teleopsis dalmanni]